MANRTSKFLTLASLALMGTAILGAPTAFANRMSCSDISFDDPLCPAYIPPTQKKPERNPIVSVFQPECSDISFADSRCANYIPPTGENLQYNLQATAFQPECFDVSFSDSRCPAYIRRQVSRNRHGNHLPEKGVEARQ